MPKPRLLAHLLVPALGVALLLPAAAPAASDYYLELEGIPGESNARGHEGEIELQSYGFDVRNPVGGGSGGGGQGAGRATFADFTFTKKVDKASPALFLRAADGRRIGSALLTVSRPGETALDYLTYCLTDLRVTRLTTAGSTAEDRPSEQVALAYGTFFETYSTQNQDGSVGTPFTAGWDVFRNMRLTSPNCSANNP